MCNVDSCLSAKAGFFAHPVACLYSDQGILSVYEAFH